MIVDSLFTYRKMGGVYEAPHHLFKVVHQILEQTLQ